MNPQAGDPPQGRSVREILGAAGAGDNPDDDFEHPGYIRFGTRSLAILVVFVAIAFALMNVQGALPGMLLSFIASSMGLAVLFVFAVFTHHNHRSKIRYQLNSWLLGLSFLTIFLFFGTLFAGGGQAALAFLAATQRSGQFQQQLGFTYAVETNFRGSQSIRTIRILSITPGKEFQRAGFQAQDVIVDIEADEFFDELERSAGQQMTVTVASNVSASLANDLDNAQQRTITINVPQKE